jgi:hypothetical protein
MNNRIELIATMLLVLLAFNRRSDQGQTERRAMFRAVFKTIQSLL